MEEPSESEKELASKGVNTATLAVLMVGQEQVFGEVLPETPTVGQATSGMLPSLPHQLTGHPVRVKNPRRFLRLQQVQPGNLRIDFVLVNWDLIETGMIEVTAQGGYYIRELDKTSQDRMYVLYTNFLVEKLRQRAAEAGIVSAAPGDLPGHGPNGGPPFLHPAVRPPR